mgnify:FL=1
MPMQHKDPKDVRLERVAHLLMCEVDEAITYPHRHHIYLQQLKQRVEELQALLKL